MTLNLCHAEISSIGSRAEKIRTSCCHLKFSENLNGASVCFLVRSEETKLNAVKQIITPCMRVPVAKKLKHTFLKDR